jgi:hypothetical protein
MPGFQFFFSQREWKGLFNDVLATQGLEFVIDDWYPSPHCSQYGAADDELLQEIYNGMRRVFLVGGFTSRGLPLQQQESGPKVGHYFVDISYLGPVMSLQFPGSFTEDGVCRLLCATLHHPARYWDLDTGECSRPSPELRAAYRSVKALIHERLARVNLTEPVWMSDGVLSLLENGKATALVNGNWVGGPLANLSVVRRHN